MVEKENQKNKQGSEMKKVAFYTLGCKVNQYETEAITSKFEKAGYKVVDFEEKADVYVINTCTVTNMSDRKSRQIIRRAKKINKDAIIVVTGCYAQTQPDEVLNIEDVNLVVGTKDRDKIVELVEQISVNHEKINFVGNIMNTGTFEEMGIDVYKERTRAYVKIQEGCQQYCAYCIIPYARGPIRSREIQNIAAEVERLALAGFKEVVLTGIHIASYGKETGTYGLIDVIEATNKIAGIERIRLGSIEPNTLKDSFIDGIKNIPKLCPHFHVSLQSGCDDTLKRMNRKYTSSEYEIAITKLRNSIPDVAISTDIMVGFPGETQEDFEKSYEFASMIAFSKIHVFPYSPRRGTPAAKFQNQISPSDKEIRSKLMMELSDELTNQYNQQFVGKIVDVLFEQKSQEAEGYWEGHTKNFIKVLSNGKDIKEGNIENVEILRVEKDFLVGG